MTKYSYLLAATSPPFAVEVPKPNPVMYPLLAGDDGVGVAPMTTQYQVVRRGTTNTVVRDWTAVPPGAPVSAGTLRHDVGIYDGPVMGLATTPGTYDVNLRATDRLGRTSMITRCFQLALLAPPLHFTDAGVAGHDLALDSLTLEPAGGMFQKVGQRLVDPAGTGASLVHQLFINGTASTVYATLAITKPMLASAQRRFRKAPSKTLRTVNTLCDTTPEPAICSETRRPEATYTSALAASGVSGAIDIVGKVFETTSAGVVIGEIPCIGCMASDTQFRFAIPPRATSSAPRYFMASAMLNPRRELYPTDSVKPSTPPYREETLNGVTISGKSDVGSVTFCSIEEYRGPNADIKYCVQTTQFQHYWALEYVEIAISSPTEIRTLTAPSMTVPPIQQATYARNQGLWSRTKASFPN